MMAIFAENLRLDLLVMIKTNNHYHSDNKYLIINYPK